MVKINVTLKKDADAAQLDQAKKQVTEQGGKVVDEYTLIKAFTAEFPDDKVHTLQSNDHVTVEEDQKVTTMK